MSWNDSVLSFDKTLTSASSRVLLVWGGASFNCLRPLSDMTGGEGGGKRHHVSRLVNTVNRGQCPSSGETYHPPWERRETWAWRARAPGFTSWRVSITTTPPPTSSTGLYTLPSTVAILLSVGSIWWLYRSGDNCWVSSGSFPQSFIISLQHEAEVESVKLHSYNGTLPPTHCPI